MPWYILIFFFSSRRRHTRWPRDWSSDVCSSDLPRRLRERPAHPDPAPRRRHHGVRPLRRSAAAARGRRRAAACDAGLTPTRLPRADALASLPMSTVTYVISVPLVPADATAALALRAALAEMCAEDPT